MTIRAIMAAVLVLLTATASRGAESEPPRWNILLVFADDWGRYASCYRGLDGRPGLNDVVSTPAVDRLAREGVVFRHAFVSSPSCTPCRSETPATSPLTGRATANSTNWAKRPSARA